MKNLFLLITLTLALTVSIFGQKRDVNALPDFQLTEEEAMARIQVWDQKVSELEGELKSIDADIAKVQQDIEAAKQSLKDCRDALYALLGTDEAGIEAFRQKFGVLQGKVRNMQRLSDDQLADRQDEVVALENELNDMRRNKISLLPEFFDKIIALARDIKGLYREKKIDKYIVRPWSESKDCLWNIAGNIDIYGDPFMWPKIWQANTDIIRNPDIIHPGQQLSVPEAAPKTSDEIKAERKYWRNKRAAVAESTSATKGE